jgi:uncharacterized protein YggU (UPF0235/DUF167 family)
MRLRVHVRPGARTERVGGRYGDDEPPTLVVAVRARAVDGAANRAVAAALAGALALSPSAIRLVAGARSRTKVFECEGLDADALGALLE